MAEGDKADRDNAQRGRVEGVADAIETYMADSEPQGEAGTPTPDDATSSVPPPPSPSGRSRAQQNALGINIPPPSIEPGPSTAPAVGYPAPALRRTSSSLSGTSASGSGAREKKRLRFTPVVGPDGGNSRGSPVSGSEDGWERDSDYDAEGAGHGAHGGEGDGRGKWRGYDHMKSDPGTPSLAETADQIRRTLSLASLDHLLVLSANQGGERERLLAEVQKAGKDLVWRDAKEKRLYPKDAERTLVLATKRGLRSFLLAFSVRAGVNVLLTLFRTIRKRNLRLYMILHAIFGKEPFRFGAMIGTFTFLNTLTLHLLRLAPPISYIRRRLKAGLFTKTSFGPPEREGAEGERRWQAAVAGAVGSLGLLWETRARRRGVAQQMFVRGLQGTYNHYTPRYGIHIPHGDVLLFGLCCGQIMFAFLMSPETMPREYINWIQSASRVPEYAVTANRTSVRQGMIEPIHFQRALQHKLITPRNKGVLENMLRSIKEGWQPPAAAPCEMVHPWLDSCTETSFRRFFAVMRFMLPVYSALHLIPALVLRRAHFQREPVKMLMRVLWGISRSCSFLGGFVVIYQALFCMRSQALFGHLKLGGLLQAVVKAIRGKQVFWAIGFMTSASLFLEEKKRRAELAMYVLPRALEAAWSSARRRAYVPIVPFGETILGAIAMAMVMDTYKHKPAALSGVVRRLMYQLVGPV